MELVLEERSSKGIVKDYFTRLETSHKSFKEAPYLYKTLMDMTESDPILFNAVSLTVDLATYKGYDFLGKNKRELEKARLLFNQELDFDQVIDNLMWQLLVYGDAYLEVRWNDSKTEVVELNPLETTEMRVNYTEHGEIVGYVQKVEGKSEKSWVHFSKDEVIYFRHFWVGSQVQSRSPFQSISRAFSTKVYANDYLQSIFRNLPPKIVYFLKNASEKQRKLFVENLIRAKTNPNMDIIAQGEAFDSKMQQVTFDSGLMGVLDYFRKEVLMVTRVPPHWIGILDGANRGIGENVVIPYETKIKKIQQKIASQINKELMPKLKLSNLVFKWNAISLLDEKEVIANMAQLSAQRFDSETIIQYARDHGLKLSDNAKIEDPVQTMAGPQVQKDGAPSRQRAGKSDQMGNKLNQKGVSQESKQKLDSKKVSA